MLALNILEWWYLRGWKLFVQRLGRKLRDNADFFSIGLLFKTLFQPFRQISANNEAASSDIAGRMSVFFDKLVSRLVGMFARLAIIIAGAIILIFELIFGIVMIIIWPMIPFLPVAGLLLSLVGVMF